MMWNGFNCSEKTVHLAGNCTVWPIYTVCLHTEWLKTDHERTLQRTLTHSIFATNVRNNGPTEQLWFQRTPWWQSWFVVPQALSVHNLIIPLRNSIHPLWQNLINIGTRSRATVCALVLFKTVFSWLKGKRSHLWDKLLAVWTPSIFTICFASISYNTFIDTCNRYFAVQDEKLFSAICTRSNHCLHHLLLSERDTGHNLDTHGFVSYSSC